MFQACIGTHIEQSLIRLLSLLKEERNGQDGEELESRLTMRILLTICPEISHPT